MSLSRLKLKFLLDENVHNGLFYFLNERGHDVKLSPKSIKNGEVFKTVLSEQRLLITRDRHFIEEPYNSSEHFGIWLLRVPPEDLESQKRIISKLLSSNKEFKRRVFRLISATECIEE